MDPDAALTRIREGLEAMRETIDSVDDVVELSIDQARTLVAELSEVADTFDGLDTWLARQGFLPASWART